MLKMSKRLYQSRDYYAFLFFLGYTGMTVDSLNDSSDYLFLYSTFIIFTLNFLSRVTRGEREQGIRIKRNDYDEAGLKGVSRLQKLVCYATLCNYHTVRLYDFFGALRAQIYDDEERKWVLGTRIEAIEEKLWNSREGPPTFDQQNLPLRSSLAPSPHRVHEKDTPMVDTEILGVYGSIASIDSVNAPPRKRGNMLNVGE
ncbi:hypothetical protein H5410_015487 [Solanum commersonii]|uniref:Ribulose bisphosphate carboxylase/oxygenase activase AAA helical domain-containing protein n=1 Tax=Solanum commersonii TaxID=4109 RepID=A0A9J5ZUN2_SOLCO|nr:hypothetical protein H5410_015487 [Solanum commersonii]